MNAPPFVFPEPLETPRLLLTALSAEALDSWIARDADRLLALTGARFPGEPTAPPVPDEDLEYVRGKLRDDPTASGWWSWMVRLRDSGEPIGLLGLAGHPGPDGAVGFGYSIDPRREGQGYATEAVEGLFAWTFVQPGVRVLRASIPVWNDASIRVAENLGMRRAITESDAEFGEVVIFEREATPAPPIDPPADPGAAPA